MRKLTSVVLWSALSGVVLCLSTVIRNSAVGQSPGSPESPLQYVGTDLADPASADGRLMVSPGVQNIQIYRANRKPSAFFRTDKGDQPGYTYNHHIDLGCWKGRLYAVWDMTPKDEDVLPCRLVYSTSSDGFNWTEPKDLYPPGKGWNLRFYFYRASNGRMLVFAAGPTGKPTMSEADKTTLLVRELTADHRLGGIYTLIKPGPDYPPSFEQSNDTGFVAACREALNHRPLLEQQDYGSLLGERRMKWHEGKNWPGGKVAGESNFWIFGKALCFYHRKDGTLVGISKLGFTTISTDEGMTWSLPVIPHGLVAGSGKVWTQRTPDGRYAMIYPPHKPGPRYPMVVTTSDDGITFRDMRVIHGEVPPERYVGRYKDPGPQYLRGVEEWAGDAPTIDKTAIWVIYSVNKEDIWVSRVPVPVVAESREPVRDTFDNTPVGPKVPGWNIYAPTWAPVRIARDPAGSNQYLELADREPVDYARAIRAFPANTAMDLSFRLAAAQADRGRLEVDLLGERGSRPVRVALSDRGQIQAVNGVEQKGSDLQLYKADTWLALKIHVDCASGKYTLSVNGKEVLKNAGFAEPSSMVYAVSFRTGEYRGAVAKIGQDLPNTEDPLLAATYRIDEVTASNMRPKSAQ